MSKPRPNAVQNTEIPAGLAWRQGWWGMVSALFFCRFFLPAESATEGDSLWIAALWMICGLVWVTGIWFRAFPPIRLGWLDVTMGIWIGGQVISAGIVIATTGDKRSATNLAWEWLAVGLVWLIVRHGLVNGAVRAAMLQAIIVTGTVLSGYGLYQHYVSHPQLVAEYGPLFDQLRTASGSEQAAIRQRLARDGIPTEGPALVLFEKRLRDSREPLGMFALANTLGGGLAVGLILSIGELFRLRRQGMTWQSLLPLIAMAATIGWCLLLTKSRTAWIGTGCGMIVLIAPQLKIAANCRRLLLAAGLSAGAVAIVAVLLITQGGLDRQIWSEAPKSLSYRFQYWQATSQLIADHPWFGVGPGNFRQQYLHYKLPEASEEIADPHNLFFDVASTGGLVSMAGLVLFLSLGIGALWRRPVAYPSDSVPKHTNKIILEDDRTGVVFWMAVVGVVLAFLGPLLCWGEWEDRLVLLAIVWMIVGWGSRWRLSQRAESEQFLHSSVLAAATALIVHLLGAGGIAMPGVSQILILLIAFGMPPNQADTPAPQKTAVASFAIAFMVALAGLSLTAFLPVLNSRRLLREGSLAGWSSSVESQDSALRFYQQAAEADRWSLEPWRSQFEWFLARGIRSNESFQSAVECLLEVHRRDPVNFWAPRSLGMLWMQKWQTTRRQDDVRQAVQWFQIAHRLYPTNSGVSADLAFALESANEHSEAVTAAEATLAQDAIYRQQRHIDRYLDESTLRGLEAIIKPQ